MTAADVIRILDLRPHPEGGHFRETWRHSPAHGDRGAGTAIYFLLREGEVSRWHRADACEVWHHYAGAPIEVSISTDGRSTAKQVLGADLSTGQRPQVIVPADAWQSARPLGEWSLVGCTVSPAFVFEGLEMAPEGWSPGGRP